MGLCCSAGPAWECFQYPRRLRRHAAILVRNGLNLRSAEGGVDLAGRTVAEMLLKRRRMDELVAKPGAFLRIELLDRPVDHAAHPRHRAEVGVIAQPDVE